MSIGPLNTLSSSYLQSVLSNVLQSSGSTTNTTGNSSNSAAVSSVAPQSR